MDIDKILTMHNKQINVVNLKTTLIKCICICIRICLSNSPLTFCLFFFPLYFRSIHTNSNYINGQLQLYALQLECNASVLIRERQRA